MSVDMSKVRSGDKVIFRDGSKIVVDDRGGRLAPLVFMTELTKWRNDGSWAPETNPSCGFDIVAVIPGKDSPYRLATQSKGGKS